MIRSRFSLLGALLAAIGLMAVFASAAQAEGVWLVLETPGGPHVGGAALEAEKFEGSLENNTGALLSRVSFTARIAIKCTAVEIIDALLTTTGGVKEGAKVKFTGCTVLANGTDGLRDELTKCGVHTGTAAAGTIETEPFHALLKLHELKSSGEKHDTLLVVPDNEEELAVKLLMGNMCAIGEEIPVFGHLSFRDCGGDKKGLEHLLTHLITEFEPLDTLSLFEPEGGLGAWPAFLDGSANIKLASDRLWSASLL
jgi:hypothetical protein